MARYNFEFTSEELQDASPELVNSLYPSHIERRELVNHLPDSTKHSMASIPEESVPKEEATITVSSQPLKDGESAENQEPIKSSSDPTSAP